MSYLDDHNKLHPTELKHIEKLQPEFVVFTELSFSYDDGYGERGQASYSTHRALKPTFFYSREELQKFLDEENNPLVKRRMPDPMRIFALREVDVQTTVSINIKD